MPCEAARLESSTTLVGRIDPDNALDPVFRRLGSSPIQIAKFTAIWARLTASGPATFSGPWNSGREANQLTARATSQAR